MTPHEEIGALLRSAIRGEVECSAPKELTNWWIDTEPSFDIGGWQITCFVEANWIYDIYDATAPDGREFKFSPRDENSSMSLFLSDPEIDQLCVKLGRKPIP